MILFDTFGFLPLIGLLLLLLVVVPYLILRAIQRSDGWIEMPEERFWEFVAKQAPLDVFVTLLGTLLKRSCYVYAHQGVVLYTWSRPTTLPAGVTETLTFEIRAT
jgi:hypothetical protein